MTIELCDISALSVHDVNLTVNEGELTLLVGQTGAGKSTLLRCIAGLESLQAGTIAIDGHPLWRKGRVSASAIRHLTMVFQSPEQQLFLPTVAKEFAYSLRTCGLSLSESQERMIQALETVNLPSSMLSVPPKSLSGGQQRRVAIATALATQPRWLLLDEPTAGLDAPAANSLATELVQMLQSGCGVIVSTHDLDVFLPLATRLIVLAGGQVVADVRLDKSGEMSEAWSQSVRVGEPESISAYVMYPSLDDILQSASVGLPSSASCIRALQEAGWELPSTHLPAEEVASFVAASLASRASCGQGKEQENRQVKGQVTEHNKGKVEEHDKEQVREHGKEQVREPGEVQRLGHVEGPASVGVGEHIGVRATRYEVSEQADAEREKYRPALGAFSGSPGAKQPANMRQTTERQHFGGYVKKRDARAKWLSYVLLSIGIVSVPVQGLAPAVLVVIALALACRLPWMEFWHIGRPFLLFMVFAVAFSGVTWPLGYSVTNGLHTLLSLVRILLILLLGVLFTNLTSTLEMKQGLEAALRWLKPLKVLVEAIAFGASLVLRFIPVLGAEARKFAEIAQIRAKRVGRPGQVRLKDASSLLMPLLFSLFQLGEDLSFAMEARGLARFGMPRTSSSLMRWERRDTLFTMWAILLTATLIACGLGLSRLG